MAERTGLARIVDKRNAKLRREMRSEAELRLSKELRQLAIARTALEKIVSRRPVQDDAGAAFFRSRQDARIALKAMEEVE